ncbi:hypothetical protein PIB30_061555 [Stylosanthes scabra]|uniref:Uncharacterized protein n=1 Tax=Stylosanthes scabra TaxID=79078 RepID=A0ABU6TLU6_9FABA|nr:hypothetical protein [Stylosanthes scabra]
MLPISYEVDLRRPPQSSPSSSSSSFTGSTAMSRWTPVLEFPMYYQARGIPRLTLESRRDGESYASNFGSLYIDTSSDSNVSIGHVVEYLDVNSQTILPAIPPSPSTDSGDSTSASSDNSLWDLDIIGRILEQNRLSRARREPC